MTDEKDKLLLELRLRQQEKALREQLPHLYAYKHYKWSRQFYESTNRHNFLCAANQIGKSSVMIRKLIHHATCPPLWPILWPKKPRPITFWYLYPSLKTASMEFTQKWVPEFLPRGAAKQSKQYGWEEEWKGKDIHAIHFNSGVSTFFRSYASDPQDLQTGTVWELFADEEMPESLQPELQMRLTAPGGIWNMGFTATLGQEMWRRTMEEKGEKEKFKHALKLQVSMYECLQYEDGSPGPFTEHDIIQVLNTCKSEAEQQRRVFGRFVVEGGLKYGAFSLSRNVKKAHPIPASWHIYVGIDIGSGGDAHPPAICFTAVSPDFQQARVFKGWRGDDQKYTAGDVLLKYVELRGDMPIAGAYYDWQCVDFGTIATRAGVTVMPAQKARDLGEGVINTLFRNEMMALYDLPELEPLMTELRTLRNETRKNDAKDDFCDALRYSVSSVPFDWTVISRTEIQPFKPKPIPKDERMREPEPTEDEINMAAWEEDYEEWNELYGA